MRPDHPALRIALSMVSSLVQPCSGAICGRYVAEKECLRVLRVGIAEADDSGEGAEEGEGGIGSSDGCGNVICMPWIPTVQSR